MPLQNSHIDDLTNISNQKLKAPENKPVIKRDVAEI